MSPWWLLLIVPGSMWLGCRVQDRIVWGRWSLRS